MNQLYEVIALAGIGTVAGLFGGLLGVGGSAIMIPAMLLFFGGRHGMEAQHLYMAAAMIVNIFVGCPSAYRHNKAGAMLPPILRIMIPASIVGSVSGVLISNLTFLSGQGSIWLSRGFGVFLLYVAVYNIYRLVRNKRLPDITPADAEKIGKWKIALVGLPVGLSGGLLGIGGGALAVPLQQIVLRIPLQRAIANSSLNVVFVSLFGAFLKNYTLGEHLGPTNEPFALTNSIRIAAILIPTAFVCGYIGGHLTHRLPRELVRFAFICLMVYAGSRLLMRELPNTPTSPPPSALAAVLPTGQPAWLGTPTHAIPPTYLPKRN